MFRGFCFPAKDHRQVVGVAEGAHGEGQSRWNGDQA